MQVETYTADADTYAFNLRIHEAVRLPVPGLIKRYRGIAFDDFGNRQIVFISSTEHVGEDGNVKWTETKATC